MDHWNQTGLVAHFDFVFEFVHRKSYLDHHALFAYFVLKDMQYNQPLLD